MPVVHSPTSCSVTMKLHLNMAVDVGMRSVFLCCFESNLTQFLSDHYFISALIDERNLTLLLYRVHILSYMSLFSYVLLHFNLKTCKFC